MVVIRKIRLPEFDKNCVVEEQKALVFDGQCKYNVIFGADFLPKTGIDIKYSLGIIEWFDNELPMHDPRHLNNQEYLAMAEIIEVQREAEQLFGMDWYNTTCYTSEILDAKYSEESTDDVVDQLTHLNKKQKHDLKVLLKDFTKLFNSTLGVYPHKKFHIDLVPGARPKHSHPYVIPCIHLAAFKKELDHLVQSTISTRCQGMGLTNFCHSKKGLHCSLGQRPTRIKYSSVTQTIPTTNHQ
jgi:hypothetical protein